MDSTHSVSNPRSLRVAFVSVVLALVSSGCSGCKDGSSSSPYNKQGSPTVYNGVTAPPAREKANNMAELEGVQFDSASRIQVTLRNEMAKASDIFTPALTCPPASVTIDGTVEAIKGISEFSGSGSEIYLSRNGKYAYKVIVPHSGLYENLAREKAVLSVVGDLKNSTVAMRAFTNPSISAGCRQRSMVTDFGGRHQLFDIRGAGEKTIAKVAARLIAIIREVHSHGVVHGDVHMFNVVVESLSDPLKGLKLIDFGRSTPFVDASKREHVKFSRVPVDSNLNPILLSPFELEGSPLARRDDMYRLSEVLYILLHVPIPDIYRLEDVAREKRRWAANRFPTFTQFHHEMRDLKFAERPDYEFWIEKFTSIAQ